MEKISLNSTKLGELRFPVSAVTAPQAVVLTEARSTARRDMDGNAIDGSIAKIVLAGVDVQIAKVLKQQGLGVDGLVPITIELVSDEASLKQVDIATLIGKVIDLRQAQVALKWVSRGNSGSWGGLKLVIDQLSLLQAKEN